MRSILLLVLTFSRVNPFSASAVLGVVVDEHIVGDGKNVALHIDFSQYDDLENRRIETISQAV